MKLTWKTTLAGVLAAGLLALSGCSASQNYPAPEKVAEQLSEKYGTAFETDGKAEPGELYVQYRLTTPDYPGSGITAWYLPEREVLYDSFLSLSLSDGIRSEMQSLVRPVLGETAEVEHKPGTLPDCFATTGDFTAVDYLTTGGSYASVTVSTDAPAEEHAAHESALLEALTQAGYSCSLRVEYYPSAGEYGQEEKLLGSFSVDTDSGEVLLTQDDFPEEELPEDAI